MQEYVVIFEQELEPQRGAQFVEAESAEEAAREVKDSVPPGMGVTLTILNVVPAVPATPIIVTPAKATAPATAEAAPTE